MDFWHFYLTNLTNLACLPRSLSKSLLGWSLGVLTMLSISKKLAIFSKSFLGWSPGVPRLPIIMPLSALLLSSFAYTPLFTERCIRVDMAHWWANNSVGLVIVMVHCTGQRIRLNKAPVLLAYSVKVMALHCATPGSALRLIWHQHCWTAHNRP